MEMDWKRQLAQVSHKVVHCQSSSQNVYLDKLDKELEERGLRFVRYADDVLIFVRSEAAANRVMKSISDWIERKLFLQVNATKSKVCRPMRSKYLGFTFLKQERKVER